MKIDENRWKFGLRGALSDGSSAGVVLDAIQLEDGAAGGHHEPLASLRQAPSLWRWRLGEAADREAAGGPVGGAGGPEGSAHTFMIYI